ncbi:23S rRNA (pseudouridine(1915)-N(3))-methyltransferase RlmH [Candidatus Saccharibacteria bacterium]|nr:23S rRNA (pseudouridine(1915)-N(3))-methyltransferase RlmH [Candidatus Saccharibacteria bacterium]
MIKIVAGGKKNAEWVAEACAEYEKRLRKPYSVEWVFMDEEKLAKWLSTWPFERAREYVICCDERGKNISSPEFSNMLYGTFMNGRDVVILIGGAYGFSDTVRGRADFVWSFSRLVFPHLIARLVCMEQIYRAAEIAKGSPYHHE